MKIKNLKYYIGISAIALIAGLNLNHTINDYGLKTVSLPLEVLAQTQSTSSSSSSNGGTNWWPWQWGNGATKDEYSKEDACTIETTIVTLVGYQVGSNVSVKGDVITYTSGYASNGSYFKVVKTVSKGKKRTCWDGGMDNCDEVACK